MRNHGVALKRQSDCCPSACTSRDCMAGTLIFLFVVVLGLGVLVGITLNTALYSTQITVYTNDGQIENNPLSFALDSTTALARSLPNDLQSYVGRVFKVYSRSAQAHTVTLTAGTLTTTWDGTNTVATFGGAIGDGLTFLVLARDKIVILSNTNVVFS